jgi:hypothetical protein
LSERARFASPATGDGTIEIVRTVAEVEARFRVEQEYIKRCVELLRSRLEVTENDVWRASRAAELEADINAD